MIVGHPLDLIKVKLQAGGQYKGAADAAAKTLRVEGVRASRTGQPTSPRYSFVAHTAVISCRAQLCASN